LGFRHALGVYIPPEFASMFASPELTCIPGHHPPPRTCIEVVDQHVCLLLVRHAIAAYEQREGNSRALRIFLT
jgi:hypothetical protein